MESNNERTNEETPAQSFDENENNENDQSELGDGEDVQGKIFIGGLSWSTTESTLRYYFEKYGELSDVALMLDKKTGKPR
jgi:RNA recognition motif-containing protein